jgi:hypothetical protein
MLTTTTTSWNMSGTDIQVMENHTGFSTSHSPAVKDALEKIAEITVKDLIPVGSKLSLVMNVVICLNYISIELKPRNN